MHSPSECISGSDVFQFLGNFCWRPVKFFGNALLLDRFQIVELLTQVSVEDVFDGVVVGPKGKMVPACQRRVFSTKMHLQVLEEVVILMGSERHQHTHSPGKGCVYQGIASSRDQVGFLQLKRYSLVPQVVMCRLPSLTSSSTLYLQREWRLLDVED